MTGNGEYKVGKGKPPLETRFGAGNRANPSGKTSAQRRLEYENAELAMAIRNRLLTALDDVLSKGLGDEAIVNDHIRADILKLLKDSEDRGLGAPVQAVDHTTNGKDMPATITRTIVDPKANG